MFSPRSAGFVAYSTISLSLMTETSIPPIRAFSPGRSICEGSPPVRLYSAITTANASSISSLNLLS